MISVIIPAYNCEQTLEKAVNSLLVQTYRDFELIVVNDGSTDHTETVARQLETQDKRIKVITTENSGEGKARNRGIDEAKGEYLCFVDSDDWVEPDYLESLLKQEGPGVLPCVGMSNNDDNDALLTEMTDREYIVGENAAGDLVSGLCGINNSVCNKMFDVAMLRKHDIRFFGGYRVGEDMLFTLRYICYCKKATIDNRPLYRYRYNTSSVMRNRSNDLIPPYNKLLDKLIEFDENGYTVPKIILQSWAFENLITHMCKGYARTLKSKEFKEYCQELFDTHLYQYAVRDKEKVKFQQSVFRTALRKKNTGILRVLIKLKNIQKGF